MPESDELIDLLMKDHETVTSGFFQSFAGYAAKVVEKMQSIDTKMESFPAKGRTSSQVRMLTEPQTQKAKLAANLEAHFAPITELKDELREAEETGSVGAQARALLQKTAIDKITCKAFSEMIAALDLTAIQRIFAPALTLESFGPELMIFHTIDRPSAPRRRIGLGDSYRKSPTAIQAASSDISIRASWYVTRSALRKHNDKN